MLHRKVSAKADGGDATLVRPSDWNDYHEMDSSTFAGLPAAGNAGRMFRVTDRDNALYLDTGSAWIKLRIEAIRETGGPTVLLVGAIPDGQFLKRSGTAIIGAAVGGGNVNDNTAETIVATWTFDTAPVMNEAQPVTPVLGELYIESAVHAWCHWDASSATPTVQDELNIASITDVGQGDATLVFVTDALNANVCVVGQGRANVCGGDEAIIATLNTLVGSVRVLTRNYVPTIGCLDRDLNGVVMFSGPA